MAFSKCSLLIVYPEMLVGGSTTSMLNMLTELDPERFDIDLILYHNQGALIDQIPAHVHLLEPACNVEGWSSLKKALSALFRGFAFRGVLAELRYHHRLGISFQVEAETQAALFSRTLTKEYDVAVGFLEGWADKYVAGDRVKAKKKIGWLHMDMGKSRFLPEIERATLEALDRVVSVSPTCEENNRALWGLKNSTWLPNIQSAKAISARSRLIPTGDEAYDRWAEATVPRLITVSRIQFYPKGLDRAMATAKALKEKGCRFLWYVIGDGPDYAELKARSEELGLSDCFVPIGLRVNPMPFLAKADLFVLTSHYEGKPMVITESMILKVPALVMEYASAGEQIRSGVDGVIVPNRDDGAVAPLEELLERPEIIAGYRENIPDFPEHSADIRLYEALFIDNGD